MPTLTRSDITSLLMLVNEAAGRGSLNSLAGDIGMSRDEAQNLALLAKEILHNPNKLLEIGFTLKEKNDDPHNLEAPKKPRIIEGTFAIWPSDVGISFKGYSSFDGEDAAEILVAELYNNELRLMVWANINDDEPAIIEMESAREEKRLA